MALLERWLEDRKLGIEYVRVHSAAPPNDWARKVENAADEICAYFGDTPLAMSGYVNADKVIAIITAALEAAPEELIDREAAAAMFHELFNCYTASKCAAEDREKFLRLKGMAEAFQSAEQRIRIFPGSAPTPVATPQKDGEEGKHESS